MRSGSCQMPRWPGWTKRAVLEIGSGSIFGGQADIGFDDGNFALLDDEHGNDFDADQERIQGISAVEQRIVLQTDAAAVVEKRLEILVIVVEMVLVAEQALDHFGIAGFFGFHFGDVDETSEAAGDVPRRQRIAFVSGDDADGVEAETILRDARLRLDAH